MCEKTRSVRSRRTAEKLKALGRVLTRFAVLAALSARFAVIFFNIIPCVFPGRAAAAGPFIVIAYSVAEIPTQRFESLDESRASVFAGLNHHRRR